MGFSSLCLVNVTLLLMVLFVVLVMMACFGLNALGSCVYVIVCCYDCDFDYYFVLFTWWVLFGLLLRLCYLYIGNLDVSFD